MMSAAIQMLIDIFDFLFEQVTRLYDSLGAWSFVIGAFTVYTIYRLLLAPVLGGAIRSGQSDMVRKIRSDNKPQAVTGLEKSRKGR